MSTIGIVGAGISGLHLALRLQQAGLDTTLYTERHPDEVAAGRPANFVARFEQTRARERTLGVAHWEEPDHGVFTIRVAVGGEQPLSFVGRPSHPASSVDFRLYLPRLAADFAARGGSVVVGPVDLDRVGQRHDLVVVAAGSASVPHLFPRDPARSPYDRPQRRLCAGLFRGIAPTEPMGLHIQLCPGGGEIFANPFRSPVGPVHVLMIEAVPGGPLEPITRMRREDDPAGFDRAMLELLARYAPGVRERVEPGRFGLTRPVDLLQGAVTPVVRNGWARLADDRFAVAVGDAWVLNDPIVGQGANLGSRSAFLLADAILAGPPYDEAFCRAAHAAMWEAARPVVEWTNAFLQPPPPHATDLLAAAAREQQVADAFIDNFNDPATMWHVLSDPAHTADWLDRLGARMPVG